MPAPKSVIEQLQEILAKSDPAAQAALTKAIAENPRLAVQDRQTNDLFGIYLGEEVTVPAAAATTTTTEPYTPTVPNTASSSTTTTVPITTAATTTTNPAPDALAAVTRAIDALKTTLDAGMKDVVKVSDLPKLSTQMLTDAIKASDDYATVREIYRAEFGKPLNRSAFEKYVRDSAAAGTVFRNDAADTENPKSGMEKALDSFVASDRQKLAIDKGITEGVKQRLSASSVPGQTQATSLSPSQQVVAKMKAQAAAAKGAPDGKTNAMIAAERLAAIERSRDEGSVQ